MYVSPLFVAEQAFLKLVANDPRRLLNGSRGVPHLHMTGCYKASHAGAEHTKHSILLDKTPLSALHIACEECRYPAFSCIA
jgi:hypothetical protein